MPQQSTTARPDVWPALPFEAWRDTCTSLHLWTQIVGKIRLAQTPWVNHAWQATFYLTARGLTTSPIPYDGRIFEIEFDFIDHQMVVRATDGTVKRMALGPRPVAGFHAAFLELLQGVGLGAKIWPMPVEVPDPVRWWRENEDYIPDLSESSS